MDLAASAKRKLDEADRERLERNFPLMSIDVQSDRIYVCYSTEAAANPQPPVLYDGPPSDELKAKIRESIQAAIDQGVEVFSMPLGPRIIPLRLTEDEAGNLVCAVAYRIGAASAAGEDVDQLETLLDKLKAAIE